MDSSVAPGVGMFFAWLRNGRGVAGLIGGAALWMLSVGALALAMRLNWSASLAARNHDFGGAEALIRHLRAGAVLSGVGFAVLQMVSLLLFALVLRACYRLRSAVCFAAGVGLVMAGDVLGLAGLLVWIGVTIGGG